MHSPSIVHQLPFRGLDALAQVATEEARRMSSGSSTEPESQRRPSPSLEQRHVSQHQHFHHSQQFRQPKPPDEYARSPIHYQSPALSPVRSPAQPVLSPIQQPSRSPAYSPLLQHQPQHRHRAPDRHRVQQEESHIRLSPVEDIHYRAPQSSYFSPPLQPQPSRQQQPEHELHLLQQQQQQHQHELQRQRQHHEQLLRQEQQQQQLARERHISFPERSAPLPPSHLHRGPSLPLHIEVPSQSLHRPPPVTSAPTSGRKSDPGQLHRVMASVHTVTAPTMATHLSLEPVSTAEPSVHTNKKRRYSDSPSQSQLHSLSVEEQERLHREREKMVTSGLGYGRPEPAVNAVSAGPKKPGSGHGHSRKPMTLAALMSPDSSRERVHVTSADVPATESLRDGHPVRSPPGRRSPPGSQSGRAKAARKSEEVDRNLHDLTSHAVPEKPRLVEKEETKKTPHRPVTDVPATATSAIGTGPPKPKLRPPPPAPPPPPPPPPPLKATEDDAHEWFLEHFDEVNAPAASEPSPPRAPPTPPAPTSLAPSARHLSGSPAPKKRTPTPTTMPEAAVALEQELEDLIADPEPPVSKTEPDMDMDVDLAVTELVAKTLEADDTKVEDTGMEVDVEDELLSLLDDRPASSRRPATKAATPTPTPGPSTSKPLAPLRTASNGGRHASPSGPPVVSAASPSGLLPPAVRPSSTRPTSERGSMPPPTSVAPGRGKEKEDKPAERMGTSAPSAKKKKEQASKVRCVASRAHCTTNHKHSPVQSQRPLPHPRQHLKPARNLVRSRSLKLLMPRCLLPLPDPRAGTRNLQRRGPARRPSCPVGPSDPKAAKQRRRNRKRKRRVMGRRTISCIACAKRSMTKIGL
ncbi:hypothetical protein DXG03_007063 [Asterophora parasitica]|uniref:Uncharacterized protein n=1 Tax=Asterophora parasitica TaxID=117018 RepID=A0A9P7KEZ2_9AGAR|nr:hypothetical protein DXG03_007063 [Asterophora parasitica]